MVLENIEEDMLDIRNYGCVYTKARSGFSTKVIKSSTTEQLDNSKYENDEKVMSYASKLHRHGTLRRLPYYPNSTPSRISKWN